MALDRAHVRPALRVIDGRRSPQSAGEEAHIEWLAFLHECETAAERIVNAITGLPVPSMFALNEANRLAMRARLARAEIESLTPDGAA